MSTIVFIIRANISREVLKIGECRSDIPLFLLRHVQSRDAFRPVARERKYLMDFK